MKYIPQIEPWIGEEEVAEVAAVVRSTFITENAKTEEFVKGILDLTGASHGIAISNGTLALVAALMAADIGPGDDVIVPDLTFIASSNAVRLVGARPVFCDVDRYSGGLDMEAAEKLMTPAVKAVMPVHLYGQMVDMEALASFAERHGIDVIEDAAEALGITYRGRHAGTFGRFGTFSFFANKTITCGEGGVILCRTAEDLAKLYRLKNHGRDRKGIFVHESIGYNFCFTDLQAAIGVAQLGKFERIIAAKRRVFARYRDAFAGANGITMVTPPEHIDSNHWFNNILVENPEALGAHLHEQGIGSRRYFYPLHLQPCYADLEKRNCPNSLWLYEHGLSLPSSPLLSDEDIDRVCGHVLRFIAG